ncbi:hypothetical protein LR004_01345 [Candidatus Gracilibacteria bacterium]|nr:hypothetical protein [Candidatus Gracilibacteria bacterium]
MKILALLILGMLSFLWGYFSWKYLNIDTINSLSLMILLAGMFVFGVLFGKIHLFTENSHSNDFENNDSDEDYEEYFPEIEPLLGEDNTVDIKIEQINTNKNNFAEFEDIQDNNFLNISNNLKKQKKQDLKIIEGIGPKIEALLNKGGIYSYLDLEQSNINNIKSILETGGTRYTMHNPSTWGKQAGLAHKSAFEELKVYQDNLVKGVEK